MERQLQQYILVINGVYMDVSFPTYS